MAAKNLVVDAGFLVALWHRNDRHHSWAMAAAEVNPPPWMACESALSEADHLLSRPGRRTLRMAVRRGAIRLVATLAEETSAILTLLEKYDNVPMSVADACTVRLTEILSDPLVLTTDADFRIYRRQSRKVVPCLLP